MSWMLTKRNGKPTTNFMFTDDEVANLRANLTPDSETKSVTLTNVITRRTITIHRKGERRHRRRFERM